MASIDYNQSDSSQINRTNPNNQFMPINIQIPKKDKKQTPKKQWIDTTDSSDDTPASTPDNLPVQQMDEDHQYS